MANILLIEADDALAEELEVTLRVHDYDVVRLGSVAEGLARSVELAPDLVLLDAAAATEERGLLLEGGRQIAPQAGLVLITKAAPDPEWQAVIRDRCVSATLVRPFRLGALIGSVRWAVRATATAGL